MKTFVLSARSKQVGDRLCLTRIFTTVADRVRVSRRWRPHTRRPSSRRLASARRAAVLGLLCLQRGDLVLCRLRLPGGYLCLRACCLRITPVDCCYIFPDMMVLPSRTPVLLMESLAKGRVGAYADGYARAPGAESNERFADEIEAITYCKYMRYLTPAHRQKSEAL